MCTHISPKTLFKVDSLYWLMAVFFWSTHELSDPTGDAAAAVIERISATAKTIIIVSGEEIDRENFDSRPKKPPTNVFLWNDFRRDVPDSPYPRYCCDGRWVLPARTAKSYFGRRRGPLNWFGHETRRPNTLRYIYLFIIILCGSLLV